MTAPGGKCLAVGEKYQALDRPTLTGKVGRRWISRPGWPVFASQSRISPSSSPEASVNAVGRVGHSQATILVALQAHQRLARGDGPEPDRLVGTRRGQRQAVRREHHVVDRTQRAPATLRKPRSRIDSEIWPAPWLLWLRPSCVPSEPWPRWARCPTKIMMSDEVYPSRFHDLMAASVCHRTSVLVWHIDCKLEGLRPTRSRIKTSQYVAPGCRRDRCALALVRQWVGRCEGRQRGRSRIMEGRGTGPANRCAPKTTEARYGDSCDV